MKNYILSIFAIILYCVSNAQVLPVDSTTKKVTFSEVVSVAGATKDQLYMRAKNLNMLRDNVKVDNKAEGTYSYKGSITVKYPAPHTGMSHTGTVSYVVTISVKDGKYKYTITDFVHTSDKGNGGKLEGNLPECNKFVLTTAGWATIKKQTKESMDKLVASIKENMDPTGGVPKNTGDW
ncbi:MAG: DUF4468 domain-containing protein [Cytophagaceae bacterium]|nr:DUF4468 domain-containing protein [Cytophagaceae bacterium]